jgi:hypothetical protein
MCDFRAGLNHCSHPHEEGDRGISNFKFQISNARFPFFERAGGTVGAFSLALLLLTFPAARARAVVPAPVTNADGRVVQQVFPASSRPAVVPAPAPDFSEENERQRWWLIGLMAGLLGLAAWYKKRRRNY